MAVGILRGAPGPRAARPRASGPRRRVCESVQALRAATSFQLPCIDITEVVQGGRPSEASVREVRAACEDVGFFTISGHGVSIDAMRRLMALGAEFFDLPLAQKRKHVVEEMRVGRGFELSPEHVEYMEGLTAAQRKLLSSHPECSTCDGIVSERFMCGREVPAGAHADAYYSGPLAQVFFARNSWPAAAVPELRCEMLRYLDDMSRIAAALMLLFAAALDVPHTFFDDKLDRHTSNLQVANYPSLALQPPLGLLRKAAHVDSGTLTLLTSDDWLPGSSWTAGSSGLQVLTRQKEWLEVDLGRGCLLVNLGSLMTRWTNGRWRASLHRVTNPSPHTAANSRRLSLAFFHKVNYDATIEVIPTTCSPDRPCLFPPAKAADLTRAGILHKHRHLPPERASALYHAELAAVQRAMDLP